MGVGGRPYWQRGGIGQLSSDKHAMRCTSTRAKIRMWLKTAVITVGISNVANQLTDLMVLL